MTSNDYYEPDPRRFLHLHRTTREESLSGESIAAPSNDYYETDPDFVPNIDINSGFSPNEINIEGKIRVKSIDDILIDDKPLMEAIKEKLRPEIVDESL